MQSKIFLVTLSAVCALGIGLESLSASNAQQTASAVPGDAGQRSEKPNDRSSDKGFSTDDFLPDSEKPKLNTPLLRARANASEAGKVMVRIWINTPHNKDQINTFAAYPYPTKVPKVKVPIKPLYETRKQGLYNLILSTGYLSRSGRDRPYPPNGWRWRYAFNAALRRSGLGLPHVISEMYTWADDMMKPVTIEVKRSNAAERERVSRYQAAMKDFEENRFDMEQESVVKGMFPTEVKIDLANGLPTRYARVALLPGKWYITGVHKVAGLKYYWQQPIEVDEANVDKQQVVELTEADALVIEGGW